MLISLEVRGIVQGIGFRPYVHRLGGSLGLNGYVINKGDHVLIVVQGDGGPLRDFENALQNPELDGCFIRELTKREPT
ncbi:MAG: acylphosphatase, partial [Lachnospiraceae bacterium]|nr:acylphosphatase [Lachnospiraceae bacterium]